MVNVDNSKPHIVDERAFLHGVLRRPELADVALFLQPDDFAVESHKIVWGVCLELRSRGTIITPLTVSQTIRRHLQDRPVDAERLASYIPRLHADPTESSADELQHLAENVARYAAMRRSVEELKGALSLAEGMDQRFFAELKRIHDTVANIRRAEKVETWSQLLDATLDEMWAQHKGQGTPAIPTGLQTLDYYEVVRKGEMVVVGGRPSTGKTALGIQIATNAAKNGCTTLFVSLEMSGNRLFRRALSSASGVPAGVIRKADFTDAQWAHMKERAEAQRAWPLHTLYRGRIDYAAIVSEARRLKAGGDLSMLVVDYFQLIPTTLRKNEDKHQGLADMSNDFKRLAVDLDICVVLLSQLNRNHTGSDGQRARVEDLGGTDALGRDADVVFLLNPDLAGEDYDTWKNTSRRQVILDIAKVRDGVVGDVNLTYVSETVRFGETAHERSMTSQEVESYGQGIQDDGGAAGGLLDAEDGVGDLGSVGLHGSASAATPGDADVRQVSFPLLDAEPERPEDLQ